MIGDDFREKRAYSRFEVNIPVNFFIHDESEPVHYANTQNISSAGVGLIAGQSMDKGIILDICLKIPDSQYLKMRGRVVWAAATIDGKYRIGIEIEGERLRPVPILLQIIKVRKGM